jgi:hypothetical protein
MTNTTLLEQHAIGDVSLEHPVTRRDPAAANLIPAGIPTTATPRGTDAQILGHLLAKRCTAILTREHHCGGPPIHHVPARPHSFQRSPPPDPTGPA